jgi:serine/threonine-protein kinase
MADLSPGTELAGCRIEEILGTGGMGVIYRATELRLGRPVALKLIAAEGASDPDLRERFEREARLTASIDHPNVIPVYAAGEEDGHLYLVMRFVPGTDLHRLLRREGSLAPARAARVVAQVADALDAAHAAGLVHRDVKPANVLIAGEHVYLSDFGITRVQEADTQITDSGGWVGTVDFMSPEHLRAEPTDARSDVYALGCVLYTALTGAPPFRRQTVPATITAHLHDPPPKPSATPGVPVAFDAVVARALAKAPTDRYASAGDLGRAALAAAVGEAPATARGSVAVGEATPERATPTAITSLADAAGVTSVAETSIADDGARAAAGAGAGAAGANGGRARAGTARERDVRVHRGRRRRMVGMLTSLVLALPALAVIVLVTRGGGTPTGPLGESEVGDIAQSFASAYTHEDERALRRLLTPEARRVGTGDVQTGRPAVVAEYRRQFDADTVTSYTLADMTVTGGRVGRVEGHYTVLRRGRATLTGRLVLGVVRWRGEPRIDLIATEPRA